MNRKRKVIVVLVMAVLVIAAVIIVIGVKRSPEKPLLKIMSDKVDLQVRNVHYTEVGDSGMKWEVTADTARYQRQDNLAFFDKITVRLVMKDGRSLVITGDRGRVKTDSQDMEIEGNVKVVSEQGDRFSTDLLFYRNAGKVIETDRPVLMESQYGSVSGVGMVFPLEENRFSILSQVRSNFSEKMKGNK